MNEKDLVLWKSVNKNPSNKNNNVGSHSGPVPRSHEVTVKKHQTNIINLPNNCSFISSGGQPFCARDNALIYDKYGLLTSRKKTTEHLTGSALKHRTIFRHWSYVEIHEHLSSLVVIPAILWQTPVYNRSLTEWGIPQFTKILEKHYCWDTTLLESRNCDKYRKLGSISIYPNAHNKSYHNKRQSNSIKALYAS